jgi:hypothetical protein
MEKVNTDQHCRPELILGSQICYQNLGFKPAKSLKTKPELNSNTIINISLGLNRDQNRQNQEHSRGWSSIQARGDVE